MILCNLKNLIKKYDVTQTQIIEKTGITRPTLLQLIKNENNGFKYDTLEKLCAFFDIELNDLLIYCPYFIKINDFDLTKWIIEENKKEIFQISINLSIDNDEYIFDLVGSRSEINMYEKDLILKCEISYDLYHLFKTKKVEEFLNSMLLLDDRLIKFIDDLEYNIENNVYRIKKPWNISLEFNPITKKDVGDEIGEFMMEYIDFQMKIPKSKEEIHYAINETKRLENKSLHLGEKLKLLPNPTYEMIKGKPMYLSYFEKYPKELQEAREYLEKLLKED